MKLDDWLKAERGRLADLARHFGLTQSAVSQWRVDGVPLTRMRGVQSFTKGEVTLDDMVPPAANDPQTTGDSPNTQETRDAA